jgi:hypothetical protein
LITMTLRQSNNKLRMSTVALFCAFFLRRIDPIALDESSSSEARTGRPSTSSADFDTFRYLCTTASFAVAGRSLKISTFDTLVVIGTTTPPRRRPIKPPRLSEAELSKSRRRHFSTISMRQILMSVVTIIDLLPFTTIDGSRGLHTAEVPVASSLLRIKVLRVDQTEAGCNRLKGVD